MNLGSELWALVAITAAIVACCGAVFSVWFIRRGADADLKNDVTELALLVERMAKTARREKMARVRTAGAVPETAVDGARPEHAAALSPKQALRLQYGLRLHKGG